MTMENSPMASRSDPPGRPGVRRDGAGTSPATTPGRQTEQVGEEAGRAVGAAREQAGQAVEGARETARQVKEQAGRAAADAGRMAREHGAALFDQQKGRAVEQLNAVGDAVHRAAERLHEQRDDNIAGYADAMAERIQACARFLERRDFNGLVREGQRLARREPEWFLGGMFVAGLALTRFLKASASRHEHDYAADGGASSVDDGGAISAGRWDEASGTGVGRTPPTAVPAPNPNPLPPPGATTASFDPGQGGGFQQPGGITP